MWNSLLEAGGKPDNKVTINAGFWNVVPFIAFGLLLIVWIIIAKLIEKHQQQKHNSEKENELNKDITEHE